MNEGALGGRSQANSKRRTFQASRSASTRRWKSRQLWPLVYLTLFTTWNGLWAWSTQMPQHPRSAVPTKRKLPKFQVQKMVSVQPGNWL